ncbi:MAG: branched-chain amino acid ABC transporter permease [Proteobacteria bacterium]|nr:branched-chain amino acid ABC transporter permease [Pseudomonadota bacterium]
MTTQTPVRLFRIEEKKRRFRSGSFYLRSALLLLFLLVPFLFPSFKSFDLMMKIVLFATLAASFDILLGYTGIISFGHAMFFGIGAYCVGLFTTKYGAPTYLNLALAFGVAIGIAAVLAVLISFFSLRVQAIFFAMITLAIAEFGEILAMKLSWFTGGEDGISLYMPGVFRLSTNLGKFLGVDIDGRVMTYYFILLVCLGLFMIMLRVIHSPLGRTLQAIRDNAQRAEALGVRTFVFQSFSITIGCVIATIVGALYAMWVRYVNPESCLNMSIMLDVLLMVIIGGMGTLYGGLVGAAFLKIAQTFLPDMQHLAQQLFPNFQFLHGVMERWLFIFGILFILVVFFFPSGIMGSVQNYLARRKALRAQTE